MCVPVQESVTKVCCRIVIVEKVKHFMGGYLSFIMFISFIAFGLIHKFKTNKNMCMQMNETPLSGKRKNMWW